MSLRRSVAFLGLLTFQTNAALAHEYWLEPRQYTVAKGEKIEGDLKNGQDFKGSSFSYIAKRFEQFTFTGKEGSQNVEGRNGDMPALSTAPTGEGLYTVSYQGVFDHITFTDPAKIKEYSDYEGFKGVLERHAERGLAPDRFQEDYKRCAKALFQIGEINANDRQDELTGMKFELVAEQNPYALGEGDSLPVRLYWEGQPISDIQIRMFRFNGQVETTVIRTDSEGRALFPLKGGGKYMLNAVNILEGDDDPQSPTPEWISYWASMVFGLADTDEVLGAKSAPAK